MTGRPHSNPAEPRWAHGLTGGATALSSLGILELARTSWRTPRWCPLRTDRRRSPPACRESLARSRPRNRCSRPSGVGREAGASPPLPCDWHSPRRGRPASPRLQHWFYGGFLEAQAVRPWHSNLALSRGCPPTTARVPAAASLGGKLRPTGDQRNSRQSSTTGEYKAPPVRSRSVLELRSQRRWTNCHMSYEEDNLCLCYPEEFHLGAC